MDKKYYFYDPKHGGCLRTIHQVDKNTYIINGAYGEDEGKKGYWTAIAKKIKGDYNLEVNFEYKTKLKHKKIYLANWKNREISWEDGNKWKELYA